MPKINNITSRLRKFSGWENVRPPRDAKKAVDVIVSDVDAKRAKQRDHAACAISVPAKTQLEFDDFITGRTYGYGRNGNDVTRWRLGRLAEQQVKDFDKHHVFEPGRYCLEIPTEGHRRQETTKQAILRHLRKAGTKGVYKGFFLKKVSSQSGARISELQDAGYEIESRRSCPSAEFVTYYLIREPRIPLRISKPKTGKKYRPQASRFNLRSALNGHAA